MNKMNIPKPSDFSVYSNEELREIAKRCNSELDYRKTLQKEKLISDFKSAFSALQEAGISIRFSDYEQESYRVVLDKFDHFEFN